MSALDLEAKQWTAVFNAVWLRRDDLSVKLIPQSKEGELVIRLRPMGWMDAEADAWKVLCGGERKSELHLSCTATEWIEMLAQGVR